MQLYPLRLEPKLDHRLWGGQRLAAWLELPQPWPQDLAESWLVYAENRVSNGPLAGRTLAQLSQEVGPDLLGTLSLPRYGRDFPLLAKFIDANDRLSIQVHPDDAYAHRVEAHTGFHGKTEAWYILHAEPGARLIYGLNRPADRTTFAQAVRQGALEELVNTIEVQVGDVIYVPAGTLHAINAGVLLFEIQQKSDLTYRVYDYERRDAQGRLRDLHLEKALDVINYQPPAQTKIEPLALDTSRHLLVACPYFALERHRYVESTLRSTRPTSFEIWTLLAGMAIIAGERLKPGDALVLPASLGAYDLQPAPEALLLRCYVPDLQRDLMPELRRQGHAPDHIAAAVHQDVA